MTDNKNTEIEIEEVEGGKKKRKKKFHWIKLFKDFFLRRKIRRLKAKENGYALIVRYLELLLASVETDGIIQLDGGFDTDEEEIAFIIDEEDYIDDLAENLKLYEKMGLIEFEKDEEGRTRLILSEFSTMVGQGESTPRVNRHREKEKQRKKEEERKKAEEEKSNEDDATDIELEKRMDAYNEKRNSIKNANC